MSFQRGVPLGAFLALACVPAAPPTTLAEADRAVIEREVTLAMDSLIAAASRVDADRVFGYYAPGLHVEDGALTSLDSLQANYRALYATLQRIDFTIRRQQVRALSPNLAMVVAEGSYAVVARGGGRQQGRVAWTLLWQRESDRWRLLHSHQSFPAAVPVPTDQATASTTAAKEIARQSARHVEAWRGNIPDSVLAVYAQDAVLMFPDAPDVRGHSAIREMLSGLFGSTRVESLDVRPDAIEVYGSTALEWGTYREVYVPQGQRAISEDGRYLIEWQRQPGGSWAIRRFMGNTVRRSPS